MNLTVLREPLVLFVISVDNHADQKIKTISNQQIDV